MDDLQTLCTASLRRCYAAGDDDDKTISQADVSSCAAVIASPSSSASVSSRVSTSTPIDRRAVKAFFEALDMEDNPRLQVESAWTLTVIVDRLEPQEQQSVKNTAIPLLIDLILSVDDEASARAETVVERLLQGDGGGEILRNYDLGPVVDAVMGNDDGWAFTHVRLLSRFFAFDGVVFVDFVQRIADATGVLPRIVEFLARDDDPALQDLAMRVLADVVSDGDPDLTRAVVDASHGAFVANVVRLLSHPNLDVSVKESAATWIVGVANRAPTYRDAILQAGAVPPLVDMVQSPDPRSIESGASALSILCEGDPPPNVDILRPAIPALARLIGSPDDEDAVEACRALGWLVSENDEMVVQSVVDSGPDVCRRLVEFLLRPHLGRYNTCAQNSPQRGVCRAIAARTLPPLNSLSNSSLPVHCAGSSFALDIVGNIVASGDQALHAIFDHQPLPALLTLLSSPHHSIRRQSCWAIGNLAWEDQDRIQQIIDADIVPPLLRCLADEDGGVRSFAAMAMGANLTAHGSQRQVQVLVEAGCLPLLLDLLSNPGGEDDEESDDTVRSALEGIHNVLIVGGFGGGSADPNLWADVRNAPIVGGAGSLAPNIVAETQNILSAGGDGGSVRPNAMAEMISSIPGGWSKIWALIPHQDDEIRNRAVRVLTAYYVPAQIRVALPAPVPLEAVAGIIVPISLGAIATGLVPDPVGGTARGRRRTRSAPDAGDAAENPPPPRQRRRRQP